jgi:Fe-S-cluster-containing dehydrogenase component
MNINELEKLANEGTGNVPSKERRMFLKAGLAITGVYMGGTVLSLTTAKNADASTDSGGEYPFPYKPHYSMVMRQNRCIDCELCKKACAETNHVPEYGYRTTILEIKKVIGPGKTERIFMPVLCNHCNVPPCTRACPTKATYKDKKTGIVMMDPKKCIGCKTCVAACPYNARYFKENEGWVPGGAIDKCNFCYDTRISKGETETACSDICQREGGKVRVFGDLSDPDSKVAKLLHKPESKAWVLRPEVGSLPNVYYIND